MSFPNIEEQLEAKLEEAEHDLADLRAQVVRLKDKNRYLESELDRYANQHHRPEHCGVHHRCYGGIVPDEGGDRWAFCCQCSAEHQDYVWPCRVQIDYHVDESAAFEETRSKITPRGVFTILSLVKAELPRGLSITEVETWDQATLDVVAEWASCVHLFASDNDDVVIPPMPEVLK